MHIRDLALEELKNFIPKAGKLYSLKRNYDLGPGRHKNISQLSKYFSRRILLETEVITATISAHGLNESKKFIQEVIWRSYWKGWLEMRPEVWKSYLFTKSMQTKDSAYLNAVSGKAGIECFDFWAKELTETGYLHNHARMWFASIWIFTLKLPWELGAEFFLDNLIDSDAASNTLSWRWVAGLQTKGKHYLATSKNIKKFTDGRFNPKGQLNESAEALSENIEFKKTPISYPNRFIEKGKTEYTLLLFEENLSFNFDFSKVNLEEVIIISNEWKNETVKNFSASALVSIKKDLENKLSIPAKIVKTSKLSSSIDINKNYLTNRLFEGLLKDEFLLQKDINCIFIDSKWDKKIHSKAIKGFFPFQKVFFDELEMYL